MKPLSRRVGAAAVQSGWANLIDCSVLSMVLVRLRYRPPGELSRFLRSEASSDAHACSIRVAPE